MQSVDPPAISSFEGQCSDGFLFDTSLVESEVVLKEEQKQLSHSGITPAAVYGRAKALKANVCGF